MERAGKKLQRKQTQMSADRKNGGLRVNMIDRRRHVTAEGEAEGPILDFL